ncbi:MAG: hypothetical protein ABR567_15135 [Myxococcales bacterium]|nr:hypothetical protein [Myxococcales bacterium]
MIVLVAALLLAQADAGTAQRVRITVRAIAASNDGPEAAGMDPKLAPIAPHLPQLFRNYKLLKEQSFDLDWKAPAEMELPGSRSLQIIPRDLGADGMIKVHLELLGEHPAHTRKLHTDYSIARGGTILVGGLRVDPQDPKQGTLLIAVTQAVEK